MNKNTTAAQPLDLDKLIKAFESVRHLLANVDGISKNNICNLASEEVETVDEALALIAQARAPQPAGAPFAWIATDLDGRADVGITKEVAKQRAGEGCTEFIPLYDLGTSTQPAGAADTTVSASIDTPEFRALAQAWSDAAGESWPSKTLECWSALVAYIDSRATLAPVAAQQQYTCERHRDEVKKGGACCWCQLEAAQQAAAQHNAVERDSALRAEPASQLDADARDAARYRWICNNNFDRQSAQVHTWHHWYEPHSVTGEPTEWKARVRGGALDRIIDEEMKKGAQS